MLRYALLSIAILSTYHVSRRCSCTLCIQHTTIQSQSFTPKDASPFVSRRCSSLRVICSTRPIAGCITNLLKELCISKRCSALLVQLVWSLAMGLFCMRRSIEILWYLARWKVHGDQVCPSQCLLYLDLTDQLLDTKSDSSGVGYIRNPGLLSKSPEKSRTRSTKPILDVTDSGAISSFVLESQTQLKFSVVPIYDASDRDFDYAQDLEVIDDVLPQLDHEVSAGSFAVVAYTMSTFKKAGSWHLNTNIQFVIVVKEFDEAQ